MGTWGFSGGGCYALACAATLPELITGAAVFASFAPYGSPGLDFCQGMSPEYAAEVYAVLHRPTPPPAGTGARTPTGCTPSPAHLKAG